MLVRAARALALVRDREYVIDQDLIDLAPLVISHRLRFKDARMDPEAVAREITMSQLSHIRY
jgi:MoxR-like ATPase